MLDKNFQKLSAYITNIESLKPLDFFNTEITKIMDSDETVDEYLQKHSDKFLTNLEEHVQKSKNDLSEDIILIQLFHYILLMMKRRSIYAYAQELGISPTLYKKEMGFLFKGKK